jgi:hypothetical protein
LSGTIKRLIPAKELGVVDKALWPDIDIPEGTKEVTLALGSSVTVPAPAGWGEERGGDYKLEI